MDLPKKSNIVGDYRFWKGSLRDFSKEGNDLTIAGNPWFQNTGGKRALLRGSSADRISKSSPSGYDGMTGFTIIGYFPETKLGTDHFPSGRICSKRSVGVGDMTFDFGIGWFSGFGYYIELDSHDSSSVSYMQSSTNFLANNRTVCGVLENGKKPQFYVGGVYIGEGDSTESVRNINDDLYIQSIFCGSGMTSPHGLMGLLIWNKTLTAAEVAQAEEWIMAQHTPSYSKRNFLNLPIVKGDEDGLYAGWDFTCLSGEKLIDKTGNGNNGTVKQITKGKNLAECLRNDNKGVINFDSPVFKTGAITIEVFLDDFNTITSPTMFDTAGFALYSNHGWALFRDAGGHWLFANCEGLSGYNVALSHYCKYGIHQLVMTWDDTTDADAVKMYVDGELVETDTATQSASGTHDSNLILFDYLASGGSGYRYDGGLIEMNVYDKVLLPEKIKSNYRKFIRTPYFIDDFDDYNESVANVTSGFLENSEWEVITGTWKITHRTDKPRGKQIQCIADGKLRHKGFTDADLMTTKEFETISGTPTLTKNATNLEIDAVAGDKIGKVYLTFG